MARWITGIIMALAVVLLLLYAPAKYIKALIILVSAIACWEFLSISIQQRFFLKILGVITVLAGLTQFVLFKDFNFNLIFIYVVLLLGFVLQFPGQINNQEKIRQTAFWVLGVFYSVFLFGLLVLITEKENFRFWLTLVLASTYLSDTGAYIIGKNFGKHKLAKNISPGKTIEGVIGSVIGGTLASFLVWFVFKPDLNLVLVLALGFAVALIGILGDLSESLLKRGFKIKDSGTIIPGHGGILDRVDSLLFTAPFIYFASLYI